MTGVLRVLDATRPVPAYAILEGASLHEMLFHGLNECRIGVWSDELALVMFAVLCWPMPGRCCDIIYDHPEGDMLGRTTKMHPALVKRINRAIDATIDGLAWWGLP